LLFRPFSAANCGTICKGLSQHRPKAKCAILGLESQALNESGSLPGLDETDLTMPADHIRYDLLTQRALRGVVRTVLADAARKGVPGEHHFYISFDTRAEGVKLAQSLREQYPEEMTIILQHQFWDLTVHDDRFEVGLSFGGKPERLSVPFDAVKGFFDPSVQFGLQFEQATAQPEGTASPPPLAQNSDEKKRKPQRAERKPSAARLPAASAPVEPQLPAPVVSGDDKSDGEKVVRLDRFRKK
jgi:hypothetical protein